MSLFKNDKKPCPICQSPTPKLFPTKIQDMPICKECDNKISMEEKSKDALTLDGLREHLAYRANNAEMHTAFTETRKVSTGFFGSAISIDDEKKQWFIASGENAPIFHFSDLKSYVLREDNIPIERANAGEKNTFPGIIDTRMMFDLADSMSAQRFGNSTQHVNPQIRTNAAAGNRPAEVRLEPPVRNIVLDVDVSNIYWKDLSISFSAPGLFDNDMRRFYVDYQNKLVEVREFTDALFSFFPVSPASQNTAAPRSAAAPFSVADELKKFKDLLDMGAITQVEFDQKKRELLNM